MNDVYTTIIKNVKESRGIARFWRTVLIPYFSCMRWYRKYFVYILTNKHKTVLYVGVTNNLARRLGEHKNGVSVTSRHFTGRYSCIHLVYWEQHTSILKAIAREKQIKRWSRIKKERLINMLNPGWNFLEDEVEIS